MVGWEGLVQLLLDGIIQGTQVQADSLRCFLLFPKEWWGHVDVVWRLPFPSQGCLSLLGPKHRSLSERSLPGVFFSSKRNTLPSGFHLQRRNGLSRNAEHSGSEMEHRRPTLLGNGMKMFFSGDDYNLLGESMSLLSASSLSARPCSRPEGSEHYDRASYCPGWPRDLLRELTICKGTLDDTMIADDD